MEKRQPGKRRGATQTPSKVRSAARWVLGGLAALALGLVVPLTTAWAARTSSGPIIESTVRGRVTAVDPKELTITLENRGQPVEVSVRAYITRNGEPAKLGDIQPGDDVRAGYLSGEPIHAARIEASAPREKQG